MCLHSKPVAAWSLFLL